MKPTLLLLTLSLVVIACADPHSELTGPSQSPPLADAMGRGQVPAGADFEATHRAFIEADRAVSEIVYRDRADAWDDVHHRMTALVSEAPESERYHIRQIAPASVLRTHLLGGATSRAKAEAAAYYVDMMVESGSVDSELALATAEQFGPEWSPSYLGRVTRTISANALAYADERCEDCGVPTDAVQGATTTEARVEQIRHAAVALRARSEG